MPRNTTGGKNFKKFKTGSEGYRARASREAVDDMLDLWTRMERSEDAAAAGDQRRALALHTEEDKEALRYMLVGTVRRKFGHGRMEVYCHDGKMRQCKIRGLLRKKGQVFIDVNSLVVVSLREAEESSDEETGIAADDFGGTSDIIGLFDDRNTAILRKTRINPRIFMRAGEEVPEEDLFDRSDLIDGGAASASASASVTNGAAGAAAPSNTIEEDVDFRSL
jgi:initiation factor 1A